MCITFLGMCWLLVCCLQASYDWFMAMLREYLLEAMIADYGDGSYADGLWHSLDFRATEDLVRLDIDGKLFITTRNLNFMPTKDFYIGGECPWCKQTIYGASMECGTSADSVAWSHQSY